MCNIIILWIIKEFLYKDNFQYNGSTCTFNISQHKVHLCIKYRMKVSEFETAVNDEGRFIVGEY